MGIAQLAGQTCSSGAFLLLVAALTGCATTGQRFGTTLQYPDGSYPLEVTLIDHTGLVQAIEPGSVEGTEYGDTPGVFPARDKSGFAVTWLGGACTNRVELNFGPTDTGFALSLRGSRPLFASCTAIGLDRSVWLRLSEPINHTTVVTSGHEE